jgi:hypothetical protein
MATRQPTIGPNRASFTYRTKSPPGTLTVGRETIGIIGANPGYLDWARFEVISSYNAPTFLFLFDSPAPPGAQLAPPDTNALVAPPLRLLPGIPMLFASPYGSIQIWQPMESVQLAALADLRRPYVAVQELDSMPCDRGFSFGLSTSDATFVATATDLLHVTARFRNETF